MIDFRINAAQAQSEIKAASQDIEAAFQASWEYLLPELRNDIAAALSAQVGVDRALLERMEIVRLNTADGLDVDFTVRPRALVSPSDARSQYRRRVPHQVRSHTRRSVLGRSHRVRAHRSRGQGPLTAGNQRVRKAFWAPGNGQLRGFVSEGGRLRPVTINISEEAEAAIYESLDRFEARLLDEMAARFEG